MLPKMGVSIKLVCIFAKLSKNDLKQFGAVFGHKNISKYHFLCIFSPRKKFADFQKKNSLIFTFCLAF